jgi:hypothetical protein
MVVTTNPPSGAGETFLSRRGILLEIAGVVLVLAVPAGAIFATAQPIPNPPNRRELAIEPAERTEVEKVQHELVRDRRREDKKQDEGGRSKKSK